MKFLLNITCDNAAFHGEDCEHTEPCYCFQTTLELATLLRAVATRIARDGCLSGFREAIHDSNGNIVGDFAIQPDSYQP